MRIREKLAWTLLASIGLLVVAAVTGVVSGGPLDPPGPPVSTMKTLDDIPGSWDRQLDAAGPDICNSARFACVLPAGSFPFITYEGVLDRETGLVWQRSVSTAERTWYEAMNFCFDRSLGGRKGWRLPTLEEMSTLIDPSVSFPPLPAGHPFLGVTSSMFMWTSTDDPGTSNGLVVSMTTGSRDFRLKTDATFNRAWCVRGDPRRTAG